MSLAPYPLSTKNFEINRMPDAMSQLLNTPSYCFSSGLMGASEWLAIEAHLLFLDNQLQDSQRKFRERAEEAYSHEKCVIIRKSQDDQSNPCEDISILDYYYHEANEIEERITQRAWLWFLPIVWSSFETQCLSTLRTAYRYKLKEDLDTKKEKNIITTLKNKTPKVSENNFDPDWDFLKNLSLIRNAICHGNGYIEYLREKRDSKAISDFCKKHEHIKLIQEIPGHDRATHEGRIVIDSKFAREAFTMCCDTTEKLRRSIFPQCHFNSAREV